MEDGPWLLQLSGARWELFFEIEGEETALELCAFAREHANREVFAEHPIGTFHSAEVLLVKDSEFADRFWLRIRGAGQKLLRSSRMNCGWEISRSGNRPDLPPCVPGAVNS